jgi:hypothetical protein
MANVRQPHTIANASCLRFGNKGRLICTSRWMRRLAVHIEPEGFVITVPYQWGRPWRRMARLAMTANLMYGSASSARAAFRSGKHRRGQASPVDKVL